MATERLRTGLAVPAICAAAGLSDTALGLLADAPGARAFVERLVLDGEFEDAAAFLAHALPAREAVSWAWSCARDAAGEPPPPVVASLDATKSWLDEPTESHRRAALRAAEVIGLASPAGLAGLAAFLCGETHAPAGAASPSPPPFAAAKATAGCVHLTAEVDDDDVVAATGYADHIRRGLELADRIDLWSPPDGTQNDLTDSSRRG